MNWIKVKKTGELINLDNTISIDKQSCKTLFMLNFWCLKNSFALKYDTEKEMNEAYDKVMKYIVPREV